MLGCFLKKREVFVMKKELFGVTSGGKTVYLYTFENKNGMKMTVSDFGAVLTHLWVPSKDGQLVDVVLGYDQLAQYENNNNVYFGATIGRNANRIDQGKFEIDGQVYQVDQNEGENQLHGGFSGYHTRPWLVKEVDELNQKIVFLLFSPDGDQGFPGNLSLEVSYQLTDLNELIISYTGESDTKTVFNPTNHTYFNLNGHANGTILEHSLQLDCSYYTPVKDSKSIPTGEVLPVANTPMDFKQSKKIGRDINQIVEQLQLTGGYDHNYVLDETKQETEAFVHLIGDQTGISLKGYTNLPGVQLYTGNFIEQEAGKNGVNYQKYSGLCLETQFFPDAVNQVNFKSPYIEENVQTVYETRYCFDA